MNLRHYPLKEEEFKRAIEPHIVAYKNRLGRPSPHSSLKCHPCYIFLKGLERRKPSEGFSGCRIII